MKTIIELITDEIKNVFAECGYDEHMRKLQFLTDLTCVSFSVTVLWQQPKHIRKHHYDC